MASRDERVVAVVGATGAVGREMVSILEARDFSISELRLLASPRSEGKVLEFKGERIRVRVLEPGSFDACDLALFSAGGAVSEQLAPEAWKRGCVTVDNSSAWRMDPDVPLVVPEVNPGDLADYDRKGIVANPNCSTIQMVLAIKPLQDAVGVKRVVVSTYQSAAGAGQKGIEELGAQTTSALNLRPVPMEVFPHQLAFNLLPHIGAFGEDRFTFEETKMIAETKKILGDQSMGVCATCVRVPVFCGHAESVNIETKKPLTVERALELWRGFPGLMVLDDPEEPLYPTPMDCVGEDVTLVGRTRVDPSVKNGLVFWVVSDNLRKGAALNAVQIAEVLADKHL